ncbi:MAG: cytochrome c biogenesis protein CcdA, partial [Actinobacteria bacterium]|nr:cytochrome c biogenesis protein CcdA [Actinomycetota bacterium]
SAGWTTTSRGTGWVSWLATFALGAVYGLAGFCSGPALGAILTVAATSATPGHGAILMAFYALGMAIPLFVLALLWERFDIGHRQWVRGRILSLGPLRVHTTNLVAGLLFIVVGWLFLRYDGTAGLLSAIPGLDLTDLEFDAQVAIIRFFADTPLWVAPLLVMIVALGVAWRRWHAVRAGGVSDDVERADASA